MASSNSGFNTSQAGAMGSVETDSTVQAFAQWLAEMKGKNHRTMQEMLSEMSIIRDGITSNNVELTDFKRHSSGISQQMQSQLTDLREKLTNAFGEITSLVKQKTISDQEQMQDINSLQGNLSCKVAEIENLKRSYSQAHQQLQSSLIQITNHMSVTKNEVATATASCERLQKEMTEKLGEVDQNCRGLEDILSVGNAENRNQMLQLQEEIRRIHESVSQLSADFVDHKRATNSVHNKLQSQVWSLEEGRKRLQPYGAADTGAKPPEAADAEPPTPVSATSQQPMASYAPYSSSPPAPTTAVLPTTTTTVVAGAAGAPMVQQIAGSTQSSMAAMGQPMTMPGSASPLPSSQQFVVGGPGSVTVPGAPATVQPGMVITPGMPTRPSYVNQMMPGRTMTMTSPMTSPPPVAMR